MNTYAVTIIQDPDTEDLILPIPDELLSSLGWAVGDVVAWDMLSDGSVSIKKIQANESPLSICAPHAGINMPWSEAKKEELREVISRIYNTQKESI